MNNTLKPKQVDGEAYKIWLRDGRKLWLRVALALTPIALLTGLCLAFLIKLNFFFVLPCVVAMTGLWQAMLLHTCEQAAKGERVTLMTALLGAKIYASLPDQLMLRQMVKRFAITCVGCLVVFLLSLGIEKSPVKELSDIQVFMRLSSQWTSVFIWTWCFQAGGVLSFGNALVRNFGLSWESALLLSDQSRQMNYVSTGKMSVAFFMMLFTTIFFPFLIFVFEIYWVCAATVAYREIFEEGNGLLEQEARAPLLSGSVLQA